jgi:hypothetical protein
MQLMQLPTVALALPALICGLRAAYLWYQSSRVEVEPEGFEPVEEVGRRIWWQDAMLRAAKRSADLNKRAAKWTAVAVCFGTASSIAGAFISS